MSDEADQIRLDLKSDVSEGEKARKKLQEVERQTKELNDSFAQGNVQLQVYNRELKNLERQADRARSALDKIHPEKLTGTARASAKFQAGLAGANIVQDVAQGGPAAGINNILGLAGNNGVRALGGEFVAAAGGAGALAAAIGGIAAAAGSMFLVVDQGLKTNKLGWSDLGSVVDALADDGFSTTGRVWGETLGEIRDSVAEVVGGLAEQTLGWNTAAESVRLHKEEVERDAKALKDYAEAAKVVAGVKSGAQEDAAKGGKQFGKEAADLGGEGGLQSVIDKLAEAGPGEDKEANKRAITQDFANAIGGDKASQDALRRRLGAAGYDPTDLGHRQEKDEAFAAADDEAIKKEDDEREEKNKERKRKAKREKDYARLLDDMDEENVQQAKEQRKDVIDRADKLTAGTGLDKRAEVALYRSALASGGKTGVASAEVARAISEELQGKGMSKADADVAAKDKTDKLVAKAGDEINEMLLNPKQKQLNGVEHIGASDFARSVESKGADMVAQNTEAMKEKLTDLLRLVNQGYRLGP